MVAEISQCEQGFTCRSAQIAECSSVCFDLFDYISVSSFSSTLMRCSFIRWADLSVRIDSLQSCYKHWRPVNFLFVSIYRQLTFFSLDQIKTGSLLGFCSVRLNLHTIIHICMGNCRISFTEKGQILIKFTSTYSPFFMEIFHTHLT